LSRGVLPDASADGSLTLARREALRAGDFRVVARRAALGRLADRDVFLDVFLDAGFDIFFAGFRGVLAFFAVRPALLAPPLALRLAILTTPSVTLTVWR
jgi:hypothetical protein